MLPAPAKQTVQSSSEDSSTNASANATASDAAAPPAPVVLAADAAGVVSESAMRLRAPVCARDPTSGDIYVFAGRNMESGDSNDLVVFSPRKAGEAAPADVAGAAPPVVLAASANESAAPVGISCFCYLTAPDHVDGQGLL